MNSARSHGLPSMTTVFLEMSITLDGFVAGPEISPEQPLGAGGEIVHTWMQSDADADKAALAAFFAGTGAFVIGRRMFDLGIHHWGDDGAFGKPVFVVTNRPQESFARGATTFAFTAGVDHALQLARDAAGDQDVGVVGGGDIARQALAAALVDELRIHIVPHLLGAGTRLFDGAPVDLERVAVSEGPQALHVTYRVAR
jgi:dihydrofolate reductase